MKILLSIFILSVLTGAALADTSGSDAEFFHPAASLYIQGDSAGASNIVAQGLSVYPEDGKLKRLKELLEQEQKQEQENQQNQDQEKEKEQDQNNHEDENPNADNEEKEPEQQNQDEQDHQQPPESEPEPEPQSSEQMSEDEAKQLLDAMKQEEKTNRMQLQPVLGAPVKVDKDW